MPSRTFPSRYAPFPRARRGMTLTELLMAVTISGMVMAGMVAILVQTISIYRYDRNKLLINKNIRKFTSELTENATFANYALIIPDFKTRQNISPVMNPATGDITTAGVNVPVADGQSGDMLVLVYVDPNDDAKIERMVGYYRSPEDPSKADSQGPVRRFELEFSPSSSSTAVQLLPATSTINSWPEVIEVSKGLSDGRLFHNFYGRSVMIKGEIIQGDDNERIATNTYNFTISPRG